MSDLSRLQATWHREIPISALMGVEALSFDGDELCVTAGLEANINVHGTAFAGSLYSVCALTGWGMCWLKLRSRGLDAEILLAEGRIDYRTPVRENIVCLCRYEPSLDPCFDTLLESGKSRLELQCRVRARGRDAGVFSGRYVLRRLG